MSSLIQVNKEYKEWIELLGLRFKQSQIKAAIKVNNELMLFYWQLGKELVELKVEERWGHSVMASISQDLQSKLPNVKGLSTSNLYYIKRFYTTYNEIFINLPQVEVNSQETKLPQVGVNVDGIEIQFLELMSIPWNHHKYIMDKHSKNAKKALFFVHQTYVNNWSRAVLLNFLDTDLYERQGKATTNFKFTLPKANSDLAQQTLKDPYCFDFLTMREKYDERELEDALTDNITKFLIELGRGFAYVGRQVPVTVGDSTYYIDLLFYHLELRCFIVVELKTVPFDPSYLGQLNFYVNAVNHTMRKEADAKTIGLLVCKSKNDVVAQYALEGLDQPIGISSYELSRLMPENFKSSLPTIEEIENELNDKKDEA